MMENGHTKTFETSSTIIGEKIRVRIIGVCQDQKSDNSGAAGLTFQTTHALATPYQMNTSDTNSGGWGETSARDWLNNVIFEDLPSSLKKNIVNVEKYYRNCYSDDEGEIIYTDDKLFLLSMKELYDYNSDNYDISYAQLYEQEGTGENHDEQYDYYSYKNERIHNEDSCLTNMYLDYNGNKPGTHFYWWLRSVSYKSTSFECVGPSGGSLYYYAAEPESILPAFCL
jgi:hypothetical protein